MRVTAVATVIGSALIGPVASGGAAASSPLAAHIAREWEPGISAAEAGGRLSVDGYGVGGLGFYTLELEDGTAALAVCVQADVGHSLTAPYTLDAEPAVSSPELSYLLWRYAGDAAAVSDVQAAALNVLSWRYAAAQRRGGGPVWTGDAVEIAVAGNERRADIEAAVAELAAEAAARRGPWVLTEPEITAADGDGSAVSARLTGPGGPVSGVELVVEVGGQQLRAVSDDDGVATISTDTAVTGLVVVTTSGPGPLRTYSAPGSQRLAVPSEVPVRAERVVTPPTTTTVLPTTTSTAPPPTTSTTSTTEPPPTSTTLRPTTSLPSTTTSTSSTTVPTTTSTAPPPTTSTTSTTEPPPTTIERPPSSPPPPSPPHAPPSPPATLPRTGGDGGRGLVRWASWLFLAGASAVFAGTRRRGPAAGHPSV